MNATQRGQPPGEMSSRPASHMDRERERPAVRIAFRVYKTILSPVLHALSPSQCIYLPTCSEYGYTAIQRFGAVRGTWLALRRLVRCHPWGKGGLDPVPETSSAPPSSTSRGSDHLS